MFKKIFKAGALFFAVGVALALIAPPLATLLGPALLGEAAVAHAVATPVLWTGAFFGAFGAIDTALRPLFDTMFGDDKPQATMQAAPKVDGPSVTKQVHITIVKEACTDKHREALAAQRQAEHKAEKTAGV